MPLKRVLYTMPAVIIWLFYGMLAILAGGIGAFQIRAWLILLLPALAAGLLLAVRSDYVKVGGITYPRVLLALTPGPVSDGGGYQALWGGRKERRHGTAAAASAVAERPAG